MVSDCVLLLEEVEKGGEYGEGESVSVDWRRCDWLGGVGDAGRGRAKGGGGGAGRVGVGAGIRVSDAGDRASVGG